MDDIDFIGQVNAGTTVSKINPIDEFSWASKLQAYNEKAPIMIGSDVENNTADLSR